MFLLLVCEYSRRGAWCFLLLLVGVFTKRLYGKCALPFPLKFLTLNANMYFFFGLLYILLHQKYISSLYSFLLTIFAHQPTVPVLTAMLHHSVSLINQHYFYYFFNHFLLIAWKTKMSNIFNNYSSQKMEEEKNFNLIKFDVDVRLSTLD